jgi:hypothetical protein
MLHRNLRAMHFRSVACAMAATCASLSFAAAPPDDLRVCSDLQIASKQKGGLERFLMETERLSQVDIDGDGRPDTINVDCPGSPPVQQADPCTVEVATTRMPPYSLEGWRVFIIDYEGKPFAVATGPWTRGKPPRSREVHAFGDSGSRKICNVKLNQGRWSPMIKYSILAAASYQDVVVNLISAAEAYRATSAPTNDGEITVGYGYTFSRNDNLALWQAAGISLSASQIAAFTVIDAATCA